jgi:hypothetical protein
LKKLENSFFFLIFWIDYFLLSTPQNFNSSIFIVSLLKPKHNSSSMAQHLLLAGTAELVNILFRAEIFNLSLVIIFLFDDFSLFLS